MSVPERPRPMNAVMTVEPAASRDVVRPGRDRRPPARISGAQEGPRRGGVLRWRGGRTLTIGVVAALLLACSRADSQRVEDTARASAVAPSAAARLSVATPGYHVAPSASVGRVTGSV